MAQSTLKNKMNESILDFNIHKIAMFLWNMKLKYRFYVPDCVRSGRRGGGG